MYRRRKILFDRNAIRKQGIQVPLCGLAVALRGRLEPVVGNARLRACTIRIDGAKPKLRFDMAGFGRPLVPDDRIRNAPNDTFSARVKLPYSIMRFCIALCTGLFPGCQRLDVLALFMGSDAVLKPRRRVNMI